MKCHLIFVCFVLFWGHTEWFRPYSWLSTQGSLLVVLWRLYRMPGIKPWSFTCKANALTIVLCLQPPRMPFKESPSETGEGSGRQQRTEHAGAPGSISDSTQSTMDHQLWPKVITKEVMSFFYCIWDGYLWAETWQYLNTELCFKIFNE